MLTLMNVRQLHHVSTVDLVLIHTGLLPAIVQLIGQENCARLM